MFFSYFLDRYLITFPAKRAIIETEHRSHFVDRLAYELSTDVFDQPLPFSPRWSDLAANDFALSRKVAAKFVAEDLPEFASSARTAARNLYKAVVVFLFIVVAVPCFLLAEEVVRIKNDAFDSSARLGNKVKTACNHLKEEAPVTLM